MKPTKPLKLASGIWPVALLFCGALTLPLLSSPTSALAQPGASGVPSGPVTVDLKAFKVARDGAGKEQLVDAGRARPGDVLEYRAVYANVSKKEVKNLQATLPIPAATEILLSSVAPKPALASIDGRTFAATPLVRNVKLPGGATQVRPIPLAEYRALRWPVGMLAAGQSVTVRARVRLNSTLSSN